MDINRLIERLDKNVISKNLNDGEIVSKNGGVIDVEVSELIDHMDTNGVFITAVVSPKYERYDYNPDLSIDTNKGIIIDTECDCFDFSQNNDWNGDYMCRHLAAVYYMFIQDLRESMYLKV